MCDMSVPFISLSKLRYFLEVDPAGLGVIILASGSEVCGFVPGRGRWIFPERKNPEYDFLRKGSKAVGPVSYVYGTQKNLKPKLEPPRRICRPFHGLFTLYVGSDADNAV